MARQGFWTDINTEPKRAYRWVLYMGGMPQWLIKTVNKPSVSFSETPHQYINHTFYYPGRATWNPITVKLVDPVNPDAAKSMENILRASGYNFPTNPNDVTTISKANAVASLGNLSIIQLGPDGETVEEWQITNSWVKEVKFGDLDYSSDDMVTIELTIRYDFARIIVPDPISGVQPANV
jgi:hypothetical protein